MKYLGLDVGTTGVKAAVFDPEGNLCGYGFRAYSVSFGQNQQAEQDALLVWERAKEAIVEAACDCGAEIVSLSVSAQGDAVIAVDRHFKPLRKAILGMDYRCAGQAEQFEKAFGASTLFQATGMRPHPLNFLAKVMWIIENEPETHQRARKYMTYGDFILQMLGAESPSIDYTLASRTMALDLHSREWSEPFLEFAGCGKDQLSTPCPSGTVVGSLPKALAAELGLKAGTLIVAGGHDQPCAALGAGMAGDKALALNSHGTAEVLSAAFDYPLLNDNMFAGGYPCTLFAQPGRFFTFALNHTGGVLVQWFKDNFCEKDAERALEKREDPYTYLISRAPMERPSTVLALPHFNGSGTPKCDLGARGAFVGLDMHTTREELLKALMDGLAYEMKLNLQSMRRAGVSIRRMRCVGGAARSEAWLQMKADVLDICIETLQIREAACLGAAMIAAWAFGSFPDLVQASEAMVHMKTRYEPHPEHVQLYEKSFELYQQLYDALLPIHHAIARPI